MIYLIIGGSFQGKLAYAKKATPAFLKTFGKIKKEEGYTADFVLDGEICSERFYLEPLVLEKIKAGEPILFSQVHLWIRNLLRKGNDPLERMEELLRMIRKTPEVGWVFICDEVGYGLISADPFENAYREAVGRCLCRITPQAQRVERVIAGIPQVLKEEPEEE